MVQPSPLTRRLIGQIPDDSHIQRLSSLIRICKRIHHSFDILITADGEVDFGRPGIQYVHVPIWCSTTPTCRGSARRVGCCACEIGTVRGAPFPHSPLNG